MAGFSTNRYATGKNLADKKKFNDDKIKIEDLIDIYKFPGNKKYQIFRLVGGIMSYAHFWLPIKTAKKLTNIPKQALSWDVNEETLDTSVADPYRDACEKLLPLFPDESRDKQNRNKPKLSVYYYINAIVRADEDEEGKFKAGKLNASERETGYKDYGNQDSYTPVKVLRLPPGAAGKVVGLSELNVHRIDGEKRPMPVSDVEYGCDIAILFDDDKQGAAKYDVQARGHTPLQPHEMDYLIYKLDGLLVPEELSVAKAEAKKIVDSHNTSGFNRAGSGDDDNGGGNERPRSRRGELDDFDAPTGGSRRRDSDDGEGSSRNRGGDDRDSGSSRNRGDEDFSPRGGSRNNDQQEERRPARDDQQEEGSSRNRGRTLDPADDPAAGGDEPRRPAREEQQEERREPSAAEKRAQQGGNTSMPTRSKARDTFDL